METPIGYHRWLISIALSVFAVLATVITAVYGVGGKGAQIDQNSKDIERIQNRETNFATRDDIQRLENKIDRLDQRLFENKK